MSGLHRRTRALLVAVAAALALVVPVGTAHAADELDLSLDGITWSSTLTGELFAIPATVVPGDVVTSALWVRNSSADSARVQLVVADGIGVVPGTLAGDLSLTIDGAAVVGGARWSGPVLVPGAAVRIPLVVVFDPTSQNSTRLSVTGVLDSVLLVQTAAGPVPVGPTASTGAEPTDRSTVAARPPRSAGLALTGGDVAGALTVAFVAVGAGLLLLAARRRSRRIES